jgi:pyruvate dehydrogenase (quinone)
MSGDGGLSMLLGDLLTTIQEKIPVKIVVFNNGSLGFVEMEMKVEGLLNAYTDLKNPDFSKVAQAIGLYGRRVEKADDLEPAVKEWLAQPGPALLDVVTSRLELVMPSHVEPGQIFGTALYSTKAILGGRSGDVWDLIKDNL